MIFEEDAILLSFFAWYEGDEEELRKAVLKYCKSNHVDEDFLTKDDDPA